MARMLSQDLRDRVVSAIDGGLSCRAAADRFGVSASSAIRWRQLALQHGHAVAKPLEETGISAGSKPWRYGVFYASRALETAIAEMQHHGMSLMKATNEPAQELDMRVYAADLQGDFHDIRGLKNSFPDYYHLSHYAVSQDLARSLRAAGSDGIVYDSVRHSSGECAAVFRPPLLANCHQERHLCYVWDGDDITAIYEKRNLEY